MGTPPENLDLTFPLADVAGELDPGNHAHLQVDPMSSEVAARQEMKEQAKAEQKKKEGKKKDALQTLKSAIVVSGIIVAVVGAAFAITKKLKEKQPFLP